MCTKAQIAKNVSDRLRKRTFSNLIAIRVFALVAKSFHKTLIVAFKESFFSKFIHEILRV